MLIKNMMDDLGEEQVSMPVPIPNVSSLYKNFKLETGNFRSFSDRITNLSSGQRAGPQEGYRMVRTSQG